MSPILGVIDSGKSGHLWAPSGAYDSLQSVTLGTATSQITFANIPQTYTHLEIRFIARVNTGASYTDNIFTRFNGDSGANYTAHYIEGSGSSTLAGSGGISNTLMLTAKATAASAASNVFSAGIMNIYDYANTSKYKTSRTFSAASVNTASDNSVFVTSQLWMSTTAVSAITLISNSNFQPYSSFALYGVK